ALANTTASPASAAIVGNDRMHCPPIERKCTRPATPPATCATHEACTPRDDAKELLITPPWLTRQRSFGAFHVLVQYPLKVRKPPSMSELIVTISKVAGDP